MREHGRHPRLAGQGCGRVETGETTIRPWSNLPVDIGAGRVAELYRARWCFERSRSPDIEGMFGRLESVLHSEMASLGHPRTALLGFAASVLAYNVLAVLARCVEQAHQQQREPPPDVSTYYSALRVRDSYGGLLIAVPPEVWPPWHSVTPECLAERLLSLARHIDPRQVATSKRKPKAKPPEGYADGKIARSHVATARALAQARIRP